MRTKEVSATPQSEIERLKARYTCLSPAQAAEVIPGAKTAGHVRKLIREGKIRDVVNTGAGRRPEYQIPLASLERYLKEAMINPTGEPDGN